MTHAGQSIQELHARYRVQARWTATLRTRLLDLSRLSSTARVLEVGSGTGVVASETAGTTRAAVVGLDIDPQALRFSRSLYPALIHVVGDGFKLPFADDVFALAYCHFLLMWTHPAVEVLREMRRVVRPGGHVATLAEPDYGGRIDFPAELEALGNRQAERLGAQGADTQIGRRRRGPWRRVGRGPRTGRTGLRVGDTRPRPGRRGPRKDAGAISRNGPARLV